MDSKSKGHLWSWSNREEGVKRILGKLDRVMFNKSWITTVPKTWNEYLRQGVSDHAAMVYHINPPTN
jgi:endonuclease/exonuclease/phosphatase family metal-dependent hydrolase